MRDVGEFRVVARPLFAGSLDRSGSFQPNGHARSTAPWPSCSTPSRRRNLQGTLGRLHLFLALGVLGGTGLAFLAGFAVARRAMRPIAGLTQAAQEVARTRDPAIALPKSAGQGRGGAAGRHAGGHAPRARRRARGDRGRARAPARVRGRRLARAAHPAHQHPRQPRAARGRAHAGRGPDRLARRPPRSPAPRCARRTGCAGWWATCCCSPAPTPAAQAPPAPGRPGRCRPRRGPRGASRSPPATTLTLDLPAADEPAVMEGSADDLHRLVLNLIENAYLHTPAGTPVVVSVRRVRRGPGARGRRPRPRRARRDARPRVRALHPRGRGHRLRQRPGPVDRACRGRLPRRNGGGARGGGRRRGVRRHPARPHRSDHPSRVFVDPDRIPTDPKEAETT